MGAYEVNVNVLRWAEKTSSRSRVLARLLYLSTIILALLAVFMALPVCYKRVRLSQLTIF
jgi:hypothetical protein